MAVFHGLQISLAFLIGFICAISISNVKRTQMIEYVSSYDINSISGKSNKKAVVEPWQRFIAVNKSSKTNSEQGNHGGAWNWCGHVVDYGPNFDRGYISFIANVLQPNSALEFGAGIGLYINTLYKYRASALDHQSHGYFIGIEPESMLDAKIYQQLPESTKHTIINSKNSDILDASFDSSLKSQALQLAMNIFDVDQSVLESIPKVDVVYSSEVLEHIPFKYHNKTLNFLVSKAEKFLVFGAARSNQGGKGHLKESMKDKEYWIEQLQNRGMILLRKLTSRLAKSCYNGWDKSQNTFVVANPEYYNQIQKKMKALKIKDNDIDKMLGDQGNVYDLYPEFQEAVVEIQSNKEICTSRRRFRRLM